MTDSFTHISDCPTFRHLLANGQSHCRLEMTDTDNAVALPVIAINNESEDQ